MQSNRIPVKTHPANLDRGARLVSSPRETLSIYFTAGGFVATDGKGAVPGYFKTEGAARAALGSAEPVKAGMLAIDHADSSAYYRSVYRIASIENGRATVRRVGHVMPGGRLDCSGDKGETIRNSATLQEYK